MTVRAGRTSGSEAIGSATAIGLARALGRGQRVARGQHAPAHGALRALQLVRRHAPSVCVDQRRAVRRTGRGQRSSRSRPPPRGRREDAEVVDGASPDVHRAPFARPIRLEPRQAAASSPTSAMPAQVGATVGGLAARLAGARRPARPRVSRTHSIDRPHPFQPSAARAADASTRSQVPPTHTGAEAGGRSGPGTGPIAAPPGHGSPREQRPQRQRRSRPDRRSARRSAGTAARAPRARPCRIASPRPSPTIARPPLTWSSPAAIFARIRTAVAGARVTSSPTPSPGCAAAAAASSVNASTDGRSGPPGGKRWSGANTPSKPAAAARCATANGRATSAVNTGRTARASCGRLQREQRRRRSPRRRRRAPRARAAPRGDARRPAIARAHAAAPGRASRSPGRPRRRRRRRRSPDRARSRAPRSPRRAGVPTSARIRRAAGSPASPRGHDPPVDVLRVRSSRERRVRVPRDATASARRSPRRSPPSPSTRGSRSRRLAARLHDDVADLAGEAVRAARRGGRRGRARRRSRCPPPRRGRRRPRAPRRPPLAERPRGAVVVDATGTPSARAPRAGRPRATRCSARSGAARAQVDQPGRADADRDHTGATPPWSRRASLPAVRGTSSAGVSRPPPAHRAVGVDLDRRSLRAADVDADGTAVGHPRSIFSRRTGAAGPVPSPAGRRGRRSPPGTRGTARSPPSAGADHLGGSGWTAEAARQNGHHATGSIALGDRSLRLVLRGVGSVCGFGICSPSVPPSALGVSGGTLRRRSRAAPPRGSRPAPPSVSGSAAAAGCACTGRPARQLVAAAMHVEVAAGHERQPHRSTIAVAPLSTRIGSSR